MIPQQTQNLEIGKIYEISDPNREFFAYFTQSIKYEGSKSNFISVYLGEENVLYRYRWQSHKNIIGCYKFLNVDSIIYIPKDRKTNYKQVST